MKANKKENNQETKRKKNIGKAFINTIKKRWLISRANTLLLIAILIATFILINSIVDSMELTPIDLTSNKNYTLTEESKERVKDISSPINIYMVGYNDSIDKYDLIKQYSKANENINVEIVDANERKDIAEKYDVSNDDYAIIVESGEKSKTISQDELQTYDDNYNTIDLTEEKITSAIINVTSGTIPKVYFLTGYTQMGLNYEGGMYTLSTYLDNEVLEYEDLDILVQGKVPDDCNTLIIASPVKDFDDTVTTAIIDYINKGGNILWLNSAYAEPVELTNVNKILALYGINPFDVGYIYEQDESKIVYYTSCIAEDIIETDLTKNLQKVLLLGATKINYDESLFEGLNVEKQDIIYTPTTSYFRKDLSNQSDSTDGDEQGGFTVGAMFTKKVSGEDEEEVNSKLVIYGENNFVADIQIMQGMRPMVYQYNNKDLILNSLAYLTDKKEDITIRKNYTSETTFTTTEKQKQIIMGIVFGIPLLIILIGIIVWQVRRRKK